MDFNQALALARMEESQPDHICTVLQASGYGDLADQWLTATSEFETAARQSRTTEAQEDASSATVVRAYARMCVSWSRIAQLRDQALGSVERQALSN